MNCEIKMSVENAVIEKELNYWCEKVQEEGEISLNLTIDERLKAWEYHICKTVENMVGISAGS